MTDDHLSDVRCLKGQLSSRRGVRGGAERVHRDSHVLNTMTDFSYIYFAEATQPPLIKIGTTEHPENRLNDLASGALQDLTVRAVLLGDRRMEQQVHAHFDHLRSHREWFHKTDELDRFVDGAPSITPPFVVTYTTRTKIDLEPLAIQAVNSGLDGEAVKYVVDAVIGM